MADGLVTPTTNGETRAPRRVTRAQRGALRMYAWLDERFRIRNAAEAIGNFYMQINAAMLDLAAILSLYRKFFLPDVMIVKRRKLKYEDLM